ncbi:MAG TPA: bifunctional phosphoglucose/phosphomannose isomerase [Balneolales bacterium]|nr:bifunctional phosphoglucose/phosphomannose isomerase [Balneolales bacterium]
MAELSEQGIKEIDREGMWGFTSAFPDQWDQATELSRDLNITTDAARIKNVVITGMGGVAMGGDLVRAYAENQNKIPVVVFRHYELPAWVGEETLVIACSYSGDTEETIIALEEAQARGAQLICITSGGKLLELARKYDIDHIQIPSGLPSRSALAYSFIPQFRIFKELGFITAEENTLEISSRFLHAQEEKLSNFNENEALSLAREIQDTLPVIYSDSRLMAPVNIRWISQFEENAKTLSYGNYFPEMTHNEIVGWEQIAHLTGRLSVIFLSDKEDNDRVKKRMEITKELISEQVAGLYVLKTQGHDRLTRLLSLVQFADWTSLYLAILNKTDPTPVAKIDLLKMKLADV